MRPRLFIRQQSFLNQILPRSTASNPSLFNCQSNIRYLSKTPDLEVKKSNRPKNNGTKDNKTSRSLSTSSQRLNFDGQIFSTWSKAQIFRNYMNFTMCQYDFLLNHSEKIMIFFAKIPIVNQIMKYFIYDQFVGGDTLTEVKKTAAYLRENRIEPMLAIPMETEGLTDDMDVPAWHQENLNKMIKSLEYAHAVSGNFPPVVHLKVTGVMYNELFLKLSDYIGFDWSSKSPENAKRFEQCTEELLKMIQDPKYESPFYQEILNKHPSSEHESSYEHLKIVAHRYKLLAEACVKNQVECLIDAEYVNINPAIALVTMAMARHVNTKDKAYIWNTYQCYMKNTKNIVDFEMEYLKKFDQAWGAKIVRGAYMEKERLRAEQNGYEDPICENIEATHNNYNSIVASCISKMAEIPKGQRPNLKILVASHNEETVNLTYNLRNKCPTPDNIIFGQLYGMCDHISSELGSKGLPIYKSMPIGSFDDVMPYLARRGSENKTVVRGNHKEAILLKNQLFSFGSGK